MQAKRSEPFLESEPMLGATQVHPNRGEVCGEIILLPQPIIEQSQTGKKHMLVRVAAIAVFSFYILWSQRNSFPASVPEFIPSVVRWSLLIFIGWYGWWETSRCMKKPNRRTKNDSRSGLGEETLEGPARITLLMQTPEHLRTLLEGVDPYQNRFDIKVAEGVREFLAGPEVSDEFLSRLKETTAPDPWKDGFAIFHKADETIIGLCGFTGPPSDGAVEIAYGIAPKYQNRGYARETAQELINFALGSGQVQTVYAHTLPENNASTRVLTKCGFRRTAEVSHPEDGLVWRWEMQPV